MDTYKNGFPRSNVFQSDEQMARFSFRTPQSDLRELISIDPSKPHLAEALHTVFSGSSYGSCVNVYRRLHECGAAQLIWEEDLPRKTILQESIPSPWTWEAKKRMEANVTSMRHYDLFRNDLEFMARGLSWNPSRNSLLIPWMIGEDGAEVNYSPEKHGERLFDAFFNMNNGDISRLVSGLSYVPSGDVGLSNAYRSAIEIIGSPKGVGEHALKAVLCTAPGISIAFPELVKNLDTYRSLVEEYNAEWAQAAYEWVE